VRPYLALAPAPPAQPPGEREEEAFAAAVTVGRGARMFGYQKGLDVEAGTSGAAATGGARQLYPGMQESPELRWALIRKIYVILSLQLLLTAVVAAVVVKVRAIPHFFTTTSAGLGLYIFLIILPFIGESAAALNHPSPSLALVVTPRILSLSFGSVGGSTRVGVRTKGVHANTSNLFLKMPTAGCLSIAVNNLDVDCGCDI
jgi:hypothetical protein